MSATIQSAIAESEQVLIAAGVSEARMETSLLMAHVLSCGRTFLIAHANEILTPGQLQAFQSFVLRRAAGEPLQYVTGHQEFFKLDFEVTPDVLIPRPETELIVEVALEFLNGKTSPYFADIGTGSGCIAVSLLYELPNARAIAVDVSPSALEVARRNAERHRVSDRLRLIESDGFAAIGANESFDLIVSNPPYVSDEEIETLQREVRREPARALAGGKDGFAVIRRLLKETTAFLRTGGHFIFEIGFGQRETV
ncbi:MAG TPA: peptide chain release factor N(5)-glutamine methyltransferase, partial [Pyrinomonadaceae bacterium]|nr:peptide chain release factor N(5)-glutamine methyltransferase [Pyrinomonadaceae bacterium]